MVAILLLLNERRLETENALTETWVAQVGHFNSFLFTYTRPVHLFDIASVAAYLLVQLALLLSQLCLQRHLLITQTLKVEFYTLLQQFLLVCTLSLQAGLSQTPALILLSLSHALVLLPMLHQLAFVGWLEETADLL